MCTHCLDYPRRLFYLQREEEHLRAAVESGGMVREVESEPPPSSKTIGQLQCSKFLTLSYRMSRRDLSGYRLQVFKSDVARAAQMRQSAQLAASTPALLAATSVIRDVLQARPTFDMHVQQELVASIDASAAATTTPARRRNSLGSVAPSGSPGSGFGRAEKGRLGGGEAPLPDEHGPPLLPISSVLDDAAALREAVLGKARRAEIAAAASLGGRRAGAGSGGSTVGSSGFAAAAAAASPGRSSVGGGSGLFPSPLQNPSKWAAQGGPAVPPLSLGSVTPLTGLGKGGVKGPLTVPAGPGGGHGGKGGGGGARQGVAAAK
jgi:hypothetical protein